MGVCCGCDSKTDIITEIKKASLAEGSAAVINPKLMMTDASNAEQILLKQKENPLKEYSLQLFQELNKFRTEPESYYSQSVKYHLNDIVKELMYIKNKKIKRDLKLEWSTKKEIIINNIMNDESIKDIKTKLTIIKQKFESIFDIIILYVKGNFNNVKDSLWKVLNSFRKLDDNIFTNIILNKIDYCVIYSMKNDNLIFKKLYKEESDIEVDIDIDMDMDVDTLIEKSITNETNTGVNDKILSFYFLFNYLDDNDESYNMINNNVVYW